MKYKLSVLSLTLLAVMTLAGVLSSTQAGEKKKLLRVGVYDSRIIPVAYTDSRHNDHFMQKKSEEKKQAEAKGDTLKAQELEAQMQRYSLNRHKQVFSTIPVQDLLDRVKDKLPGVAETTGVDMIVSQWQVDYSAPDIDIVDITFEMAKMLEPTRSDAALRKAIEELKKVPPLAEAEVERLAREYPD